MMVNTKIHKSKIRRQHTVMEVNTLRPNLPEYDYFLKM